MVIKEKLTYIFFFRRESHNFLLHKGQRPYLRMDVALLFLSLLGIYISTTENSLGWITKMHFFLRENESALCRILAEHYISFLELQAKFWTIPPNFRLWIAYGLEAADYFRKGKWLEIAGKKKKWNSLKSFNIILKFSHLNILLSPSEV